MFSADPQARILIVDDQPENLIALEALLADIGQEIVKANSGREALKLLLEEEFALILLDIQMPDMDGFEAANLIRRREASQHTPIIFLTAMYTEDVHESEAYALGAVDFITKPFSPQVLLSKVHFFVDLWKKNQRIQLQARLIREIEKGRMLEAKERLEAEKQRMIAELMRNEKEKELLEERSSQLQKADRLKDEFLANMSHEIRTPMNAVIGFAELLLGTTLDTEQYEYAEKIKESAQGLLTLINDILDLSKIAAGKLDLEPVDFALAPLVEGTAAILSESAREKSLSLMTFIDPELPPVMHGDPGRLRQVLLNLIGNAIKFTESGEVVVRATKVVSQDQIVSLSGDNGLPDRCNVSFTISDTGIGLSQEEIQKLFRPFTQADGSTTRRFGGTGLGLSISKRLVELMGGEIGVDSQPGRGATFWFELSLKSSDAIKEAVRKHAEELEKLRILIVDHQASARAILKAYVNSWNVRCDTAENYQDALSMLFKESDKEKPYDLVITELRLPDNDGFKLLKTIKNDSKIGGTKVILCTNEDKQGLGQRALAAGFSAYLTKPIEQSSLYDCIVRIMVGVATEDEELPILASKSSDHMLDAPIILLAEDNPVNQKVTQLQLTKLGFNCEAVGNGREAIHALEQGQYALVLMDCQMPDMDGLEATKSIRKAEALTGCHIPIIGLTAHAMGGDREKCIAAGMDDYLSKPASMDQLKKALNKWLKQPEKKVSEETEVIIKSD